MMMRYLMLIAAFLSGLAFAAPVVVASQTTSTSGTSHVVAIPAGAAGDFLLVVSAADYDALAVPSLTTGRGSGFGAGSLNFCGHAGGFFQKVSNGAETSITINSSASIGLTHWVLRVSGVTFPTVVNMGGACALSPSLSADPPGVNLGASYDALFVALAFYNGSAPTLPPSGYGYGLDAGSAPNLSLSFKSAVASYEDAGPFSLPAAVKSTAVAFALR